MISESQDRPGAATVAVLAAFLVGAGAVGASSVLSSAAPRVLVAVVLVVAGWAVARLANDLYGRLPVALGDRVLRGIGTSFVVLGAYLLGLALLTAAVPESPAAVVLLVYGVPALALLAMSTVGMRAWASGAGAILPMLAVLLLVAYDAGAAVVSVSMVVVAAVLAVVVVRSPAESTLGDLASAASAMAASFAFGAGTSPFGSLGTTQTGGAAGTGEGLTGGAQAAVAGGALLVATVVLVLAVLRWDLAGGVLAGSVFTMPPVLLRTDLLFGTWPAGTQVVLVAVPVLAALVALVAIRSYGFRRALVSVPAALRSDPVDEPVDDEVPADDADSGSAAPAEPVDDAGAEPGGGLSDTGALVGAADGARRVSDAVSAAACAVVVAAAAVAFVALAMPVFGWEPRAQGSVAVLVLVGVSALAYWLPGTPGAAGAVVALLGMELASPWLRLLTAGSMNVSTTEQVITGVVDLAAAGALVWFLVRRHPRVGVYAAAAYALAGSAAAFLGSLLFDPGYLSGQGEPFATEWAPVLIVGLPLLLLAIPAAAVAFGSRAAVGQAVGAVVVAAAGFLPLKVLVGEFATSGGDGLPAGYALQVSLAPLTPSDWLMTSAVLRSVTGPALVALVAMVLVAFVLAASLARRPHAPLAAAVTLLLLSAVQVSLLTALATWSADEAETLGWVLGAVAVASALVAVGVSASAMRRT